MHVKFKSTRGHRDIDYSDPAVMRQRYEAKQSQRKAAARARYVLGRMVERDGLLVLEAVAWSAAMMPDPEQVTCQLHQMARWSTRQAINQWAWRYGIRDYRPLDLRRLGGSTLTDCR